MNKDEIGYISMIILKMKIKSCSDCPVLKETLLTLLSVWGNLAILQRDTLMEYWEERKMKRLSRIRICIFCGNEIDNSQHKIQKRTKFCSEDCVDDYKFNKQLKKVT